MVLETNDFARDSLRVKGGCHKPATLFLCGESPHEHVHTRRYHQGGAIGVIQNGVRFLGLSFWPADVTAVEVGWIDQRYSIYGRFCAQPLMGTEVYDTPSAHTQP